MTVADRAGDNNPATTIKAAEPDALCRQNYNQDLVLPPPNVKNHCRRDDQHRASRFGTYVTVSREAVDRRGTARNAAVAERGFGE